MPQTYQVPFTRHILKTTQQKSAKAANLFNLTEDEYSDFERALKVQTYRDSKGNSGVQVRSRYDGDAGWLDGPQVGINPPAPWRSGFIYDETREAKIWISPIAGKPSVARPEHAPKGWT